jgi:hypothetical protein
MAGEVTLMTPSGPSPNNEQRYWFPAKRYGWGWGPPTTWQGWTVMIVWLVVLLIAGLVLMPAHVAAFLSVTLLMTVLLLLICYAKGEPPAWRWGERGGPR